MNKQYAKAGVNIELGNQVKKEIESDKGFVKEVASEQQRIQFTKELTAAMPNIIGLMVSLRQAFNRKNPNNIYKQDAAPVKESKYNIRDYRKFF